MSDLSDWDASSGDEKKAAPAPPKPKAPIASIYGRRTFDDEEDDLKEDWEQEDEAPKPQPVLAPPKKKGNLKKKLAEKEAEERRRAELGLDSDEEGDEVDPMEKKKQDKEMQLRSDLDNAAALLGQTSVKDTSPDEGLAALQGAKPVTKGDWEKLAQDIYAKVIAGYAGRPGFDKNFGPALTLLLADKMRDTDMRLTATKLRDLAEKKARAEKEAKKAGGAQKKPKPKNLSTASAKDGIDITNYDEGLSDDSFM